MRERERERGRERTHPWLKKMYNSYIRYNLNPYICVIMIVFLIVLCIYTDYILVLYKRYVLKNIVNIPSYVFCNLLLQWNATCFCQILHKQQL